LDAWHVSRKITLENSVAQREIGGVGECAYGLIVWRSLNRNGNSQQGQANQHDQGDREGMSTIAFVRFVHFTFHLAKMRSCEKSIVIFRY